MSKNETIGRLTTERDAARKEAKELQAKLDSAKAQIARYKKRERLEADLDAIEEEIEKHDVPTEGGFAAGGLRHGYPIFRYNALRL